MDEGECLYVFRLLLAIINVLSSSLDRRRKRLKRAHALSRPRPGPWLFCNDLFALHGARNNKSRTSQVVSTIPFLDLLVHLSPSKKL